MAGLIPAGAGQTCPTRSVRSPIRAHPRGCGADSVPADYYAQVMGSSPRVRGRRRCSRRRALGTGLIPAGAGQTGLHRAFRRCSGAHPRGCGADFDRGGLARGIGGSSPRVRGRRSSASTLSAWAWAHPRGCGADVAVAEPVQATEGSSPRVRGRPADDPVRLGGDGLIPAGAGQTPPTTS